MVSGFELPKLKQKNLPISLKGSDWQGYLLTECQAKGAHKQFILHPLVLPLEIQFESRDRLYTIKQIIQIAGHLIQSHNFLFLVLKFFISTISENSA